MYIYMYVYIYICIWYPPGTFLFGVVINTIGLLVYWFGLVPGWGGARQALSVPARAVCTDGAMSHNFTVVY